MKIVGEAVPRYTWYLNGERLSGVLEGDPEEGWVRFWSGGNQVRRTGMVEAIDPDGKVYRAERKR